MLLSQMSNLVDMFFYGFEADYKLVVLKKILTSLFETLNIISVFLGLVMTSIMYGWYGFEPQWIASDLTPDTKFTIIEKHFAYFLGFGFPYAVLNKVISLFFVDREIKLHTHYILSSFLPSFLLQPSRPLPSSQVSVAISLSTLSASYWDRRSIIRGHIRSMR